jgi:hypothetical protein
MKIAPFILNCKKQIIFLCILPGLAVAKERNAEKS